VPDHDPYRDGRGDPPLPVLDHDVARKVRLAADAVRGLYPRQATRPSAVHRLILASEEAAACLDRPPLVSQPAVGIAPVTLDELLPRPATVTVSGGFAPDSVHLTRQRGQVPAPLEPSPIPTPAPPAPPAPVPEPAVPPLQDDPDEFKARLRASREDRAKAATPTAKASRKPKAPPPKPSPVAPLEPPPEVYPCDADLDGVRCHKLAPHNPVHRGVDGDGRPVAWTDEPDA
jgi:hypothetical protein